MWWLLGPEHTLLNPLLQLSRGALPLISAPQTKLFNSQEMEGPRIPALLLRRGQEGEGLS